jgi:hypothetical protein
VVLGGSAVRIAASVSFNPVANLAADLFQSQEGDPPSTSWNLASRSSILLLADRPRNSTSRHKLIVISLLFRYS